MVVSASTEARAGVRLVRRDSPERDSTFMDSWAFEMVLKTVGELATPGEWRVVCKHP